MKTKDYIKNTITYLEEEFPNGVKRHYYEEFSSIYVVEHIISNLLENKKFQNVLYDNLFKNDIFNVVFKNLLIESEIKFSDKVSVYESFSNQTYENLKKDKFEKKYSNDHFLNSIAA